MSGEKHVLPPVRGTTGLESMLLDPAIYERFHNLDQGGKICAEYVWIGEAGGSGIGGRAGAPPHALGQGG